MRSVRTLRWDLQTLRSGIVTDYRFTTAKEHDSTRIDELVEHEDKVVLADSVYASRARRETRDARRFKCVPMAHNSEPRIITSQRQIAQRTHTPYLYKALGRRGVAERTGMILLEEPLAAGHHVN